jgi:uncharacterized membrane protein YphA (DoxX/SURF4 family)
VFLGVTFLFAGLQKLANPNFFRAASPISIHAQLAAAARTSPIKGLLHHLVSVSTLLGLVIALGEVAIGLGVLAGVMTRAAAVGGMLLAFGLFLTVSFHSSPYYTGADIVFVFAFTPLLIAGDGRFTAVEGVRWLAHRYQAGGLDDLAVDEERRPGRYGFPCCRRAGAGWIGYRTGSPGRGKQAAKGRPTRVRRRPDLDNGNNVPVDAIARDDGPHAVGWNPQGHEDRARLRRAGGWGGLVPGPRQRRSGHRRPGHSR